ncbi:transcriptional regulator, TetR family [Burkholderia sp. H160]|nr:transcriptional regulator, TetR family [Burkholderia sp. H160]
MSSSRPTRTYRSPARRKQAEQTRARVIAASKWLFTRHGYVDTTIDAIANRAGVSPQTVYAAFGSKAAVLAALLETVVASVRQDELPVAVVTAEDQLRRCARMARRIYDAIGKVLSIGDNLAGELSDVVQEREQIRFASLAGVIETLSAANKLARYLDTNVAHDLLWSLTGHEMYRRLVVERGWSSDQYEAELGNLLIQALLAQQTAPKRRLDPGLRP